MNGARLTGTINARGVRVLWHEGTLYVVHSTSKVQAFDAPTEPVKKGNQWQHNGLTIYRPGCGCQKSASLGAMTVEQIVALGRVTIDA